MSNHPSDLQGMSDEEKRQLLLDLMRKKNAPKQVTIPLSFGQMRFWILDQIDESSGTYNILPYGLRIEGPLNPDVFQKAMETIYERHQILRTTFREQDGNPIQAVHNRPLTITFEDLSESIPETTPHFAQHREAEVKRRQVAESKRTFDLEKGPLIDVHLLKLSDMEHVLLLTLHHIIADAWSIGVIMRELETLYAAFQQGLPSPLPPLPAQYSAFVDWEREKLTPQHLARQVAYWRKRLDGMPPLLELPYDLPRPAVQSHRSAEEDFTLCSTVSQGLHALSREHHTSLMINLMAAFKVLLARISDKQDIPIGQAVSNRSRSDWEQLVGFFVNTVVVRTAVDLEDSFLQHLHSVKSTALEAYQHKEAPFEQVVNETCKDRSLAFSPLFQVLFALVDARTMLNIPGLDIVPLREIRTRIQFDLHLLMWDWEDGIHGTLEYNTDLFTRAGIRRLLSSFKALLTGIVANPQARLGDLPIMDEAQRDQALRTFNQTDHPYDLQGSLHQLVEAQAHKTPRATALTFKGESWDYATLNHKADCLAGLLQEQGVEHGSIVGIYMDRKFAMPLTLLAVLKAGGAYLPLEPDHPEDRVSFQIKDACIQHLVTTAPTEMVSAPQQLVLTDTKIANLQERRPTARKPHPQSGAYVIYTSGSTGRPKGVLVSHQAICNRLLWMQDSYALTAEDRILQKTPYSFDVSVWEFFWPLISGAIQVIAEPKRHWDTTYLYQTIKEQCITTVHFVPSMLQLFLEESDLEQLVSLKRVICSGEALPTDLYKRFSGRLNSPLHNLYGPTEAAVDVSFHQCEEGGEGAFIPIGMPVHNTRLFVADRRLNPVPVSVPGELLLAGVQLARGYLNRPSLTALRFVPDPYSGWLGSRLYRSGDRVRRLPEGDIEFLERIDHQVKIRGYRIELGEIEAALHQLTGIQEAAVAVRQSRGGDPRLVAYIVVDPQAPPNSEYKELLTRTLPDYMVPSLFVSLPAMPLTTNGKINRAALPEPEEDAVAVTQNYMAPTTPVEKRLALIWSELLGLDRVGINDRFFELGGHSFLLIKMHRIVREQFGVNMELVDVFQHPTVASLAHFLQRAKMESNAVPLSKTLHSARAFEDGIAVIGMAGRFPGADSVDALWENLIDGVESISFFDEKTLQEAGVSPEEYQLPGYVPASGILGNITDFDANFFGFTPREAEITDPQQRLFLECAHEALEHAGHASESFQGHIGVFAGTGMSTYFLTNLLSQPGILKSAELYQVMVGNDRNFPATQTSHKLNLTGPSINIANACSSSLIAVHMACKSLLEQESDMALAGGMKVIVPHKMGYHYQEGNIHSPDGHCRTFDASAKGIVMSSGGGIVVLRRLKDALAQRDHILAVIKGSAINNDGAMKVGFMAPGAQGQEEVITAAHQAAQIDPDTIGYLEAHGTGTTLGDPIEIAALTAAFRRKSQRNGFCYIGSIKTNMGHLDHAAGIAGLIKTVLALQNRKLPPSLHFEQANPAIDFESSPFKVITEARPWRQDGPLRAGVSSFGIGGTNAHMVLEEAPVQAEKPTKTNAVLLPLSAKTDKALSALRENLGRFLSDKHHLPSVAYTLQNGRNHYAYRCYLVGADQATLAQNLTENRSLKQARVSGKKPYPVFMFPGQGTQHARMLAKVYEGVTCFRDTVDFCSDILKPILNEDLRTLLYAEDIEVAEARLVQTQLTQPALFVSSYAAAVTLIHWGIEPMAMIGHSIGEYVAATLAGVFELEDALTLVATRGRLMQEVAPGGMISVNKTEAQLKQFLGDTFDLAALNGPSNSVISGPREALDQLIESMGEGRKLKTSHGFHSRSMEPVLEEFKKAFEGIQLSAPSRPFISNLSGRWIEAREARDPDYWVRQLREPVRFSQGMELILKEEHPILIQVGPGTSLINLAAQQPQGEDVPTCSFGRHPKQSIDDLTQAFNALGRLWLHGCQINWRHLYEDEIPERVVLPTYPFERRRFWVEPGEGLSTGGAPSRDGDLENWFYTPSWQRRADHLLRRAPKFPENAQWMIIGDAQGLGAEIAKQLNAADLQVTRVDPIDQTADLHLDFSVRKDFDLLFAGLDQERPLYLLHLLNIGQTDHEHPQNPAFFSLLWSAQALSQANFNAPVTLGVFTNLTHDVLGGEPLHPGKSLVLGPIKVLNQELPGMSVAQVDLDNHLLQNKAESATRILGEMNAGLPDAVVAHRGRARWVPTYYREDFSDVAEAPVRLKVNGVYLITGGLGGIGKTFAEHLAARYNARLIITSRRDLPNREHWPDLKDTDPTYASVKTLQHLEKVGGKVQFVSLDVTDKDLMAQLFKHLVEKYGRLDGIIHAAGVAGGGLALVKDRESAEKVLAPKLGGTHCLAEGLRKTKPDFALFCSSTSAILGGVGQIDYCAANNYQDAMALELTRETGVQVVSVNWPAWQEVGMAAETVVPDGWRIAHEHNIRMGIKPEEGVTILERLLRSDVSRVVISTIDVNKGLQFIETAQVEMDLPTGMEGSHRERPNLTVAYEAPRDDVEQTLANIWSNFLGIDGIGIHDDFFDLGGHSLLATQITGKIREHFAVDIHLQSLFDQPTIAQLAVVVLEAQMVDSDPENLEELLSEIENLSDIDLDGINEPPLDVD